MFDSLSTRVILLQATVRIRAVCMYERRAYFTLEPYQLWQHSLAVLYIHCTTRKVLTRDPTRRVSHTHVPMRRTLHPHQRPPAPLRSCVATAREAAPDGNMACAACDGSGMSTIAPPPPNSYASEW